MNKRYMDILKEYLKKNERKAIGYSEEEITNHNHTLGEPIYEGGIK